MEAAFELEIETRPDQLDVQFDSEDEPCTAEVADCTCPDFCERDHANE